MNNGHEVLVDTRGIQGSDFVVTPPPDGSLHHGYKLFDGLVIIPVALFPLLEFRIEDRSKLVALKAHSDEMAPAIAPGDVMIVDTGADSFTSDGVYLFKLNGEYLVRRLQRNIGGPLCALPVNPCYPVIQLEEHSLEIVGRVLPIWQHEWLMSDANISN